MRWINILPNKWARVLSIIDISCRCKKQKYTAIKARFKIVEPLVYLLVL